MTARGARRLRDELDKLHAANTTSERINELEQILASADIVDPPNGTPNSVTFGATVTITDRKDTTGTFTIVGVDELDFYPDAISWVSSVGRALLGAELGDWIKLDGERRVKIVGIEFKNEAR